VQSAHCASPQPPDTLALPSKSRQGNTTRSGQRFGSGHDPCKSIKKTIKGESTFLNLGSSLDPHIRILQDHHAAKTIRSNTATASAFGWSEHNAHSGYL
jgi:hypothetical protein